MFHEFLTTNREEIIRRTRARGAKRPTQRASEDDSDYGVPVFLNQLIETLRLFLTSNEEIARTAALNGGELLKLGFSVAQVVHGYGDICQVVTELAVERQTPIGADEFRTINRCLDDAIAQSLTEYARQRERSIVTEGTERLGYLAHELRNLLSTAMLSFDALKRGSVGMGGSTSDLLSRSLVGLRNLIDRTLTEVRLGARLQKRESVLLAELIGEIEIAAGIEAKFRELQLNVSKVEYGLRVEVDRALLMSAVENLLQNAFKFSRPHGQVSLRVHTREERVLIEVEDDCGGLSTPNPEELFRPFEQCNKNRSGLGLGLSICRQSIEANGGEIHVRDLPGKGCVFTIDLPRYWLALS